MVGLVGFSVMVDGVGVSCTTAAVDGVVEEVVDGVTGCSSPCGLLGVGVGFSSDPLPLQLALAGQSQKP